MIQRFTKRNRCFLNPLAETKGRSQQQDCPYAASLKTSCDRHSRMITLGFTWGNKESQGLLGISIGITKPGGAPLQETRRPLSVQSLLASGWPRACRAAGVL